MAIFLGMGAAWGRREAWPGQGLAIRGGAGQGESPAKLPQIEAEKRQRQYKLTDEERERKANEPESQLEMGAKTDGDPGTAEAVRGCNQRSLLEAGAAWKLLQRIHKAIHPTGTVRQAAQPLPSAVPEGGTAAADEAQKLKTQAAEAEQQIAEQQKQSQAQLDFFKKYIPKRTGRKL